MEWTLWFGSILVQQLPPEKLVDLIVKVWPQVQESIPHEKRVDFLKNVAEKHLATLLDDLSREERASLMNTLLPMVSREFPLYDLDLLTAFPSPDREYQNKAPE
jgi:L-fucose isomerase-like protein